MKKASLAAAVLTLAAATGLGAVLLSPDARPEPATEPNAAAPTATTPEPCPCTGCQAMVEFDDQFRAGAATSAGSVIVLDGDEKATAPTDEQIREAGGDAPRRVGAVRDVTPADKDGTIARIVEVDFIETRTVAVIGEDGNASLLCEVDRNAAGREETH